MRHRIVLLSALLLAAAPALAQTETPPSPQVGASSATSDSTKPATNAPPGGHKPGMPGDRSRATLDERISTMHRRLQITPQQENAWNGFAQVMRENASSVEHDYQQRGSGIASMNAADNLRDYARIEADRAKGVQRLSTAFDTLYGQLSDQQKKTADTMFRHYNMEDHRGRHAQAKSRPHASPTEQTQ